MDLPERIPLVEGPTRGTWEALVSKFLRRVVAPLGRLLATYGLLVVATVAVAGDAHCPPFYWPGTDANTPRVLCDSEVRWEDTEPVRVVPEPPGEGWECMSQDHSYGGFGVWCWRPEGVWVVYTPGWAPAEPRLEGL